VRGLSRDNEVAAGAGRCAQAFEWEGRSEEVQPVAVLDVRRRRKRERIDAVAGPSWKGRRLRLIGLCEKMSTGEDVALAAVSAEGKPFDVL